jgi:hypothetical protein
VTNQLPVAILSWKTRISTRRLLRRPVKRLITAACETGARDGGPS